jgi:PAS domain S-box-containing protein
MTSINRYFIFFNFNFMPQVTFLPRFQKKWIVVFFLPLILLGSKFVHAQAQQLPSLVLNDTKSEYPLGFYMEIFEDPSGKLGIEEVSSAAYQDRFIASSQTVLDRGFTKSALWGRFKIENSTTNTNWLLVLDDTRMGLIDVYVAGEDGKSFTHQQSGQLVPFNQRQSPYTVYVFDIPLQQGQAQEIYVRLKTNTTFYAPLSVWAAGAFFDYHQSQTILLSLFYGAMLVMLTYNLVLFFVLKDVSYLYLSLYILSYSFFLAMTDGLAGQYLWPASTTRVGIAMLSICGFTVFGCLFMLTFLQIPRYSRGLAQFIKSIIAAAIVLLVVSPFLSQAGKWANLLAIILSVTMGVSGIFVFSKGYQPARFYIIAWVASIVTILIYALSNLGVLNRNWISEKGLYFSAIILVVLWSLALADRVSLLQSESGQAHQKALSSENKISRFLNALPFGIMVHTKDTRLAYINRFAQNDVGFYPADGDYSITNPKLQDVMRNLQLFEVGSGKVIEITDLPLHTVFNGENVIIDNLEVDIRGQRIPLEIRSMPVFDENKQVEYALTFFHDISDRRKQEAEIVASHLLLNGILENAADAIVSMDERQNIIMFNKQAEIVFGYQAHEVLHRPIDILLPEQFRTAHRQNIKNFENTNSRMILMMGDRIEISGLRKNGEKFPAKASVSMTQGESGKIFSVFLHDITEEKKQARELWESQSRYLNLYMHTTVGILLADPEGRIIQANRAFQEMIGYSEAELKEMSYFDITYPDDLEISRIRREELLTNPDKENILEKRFVRKDGQVIWTTRTASVMSDAQGKILNTYSIINDITDRKFNETQLREYHERLEDLVANRTMELHQSHERLAILNQASRVVNRSILNPEQVYIAIHTTISWLTPTDVFSLILVDEEHGTFEEVYLATPEGRQAGIRGTLENSFVKRVLEKGTSLHMIEFPGESDENGFDRWPRATEQIKSGLAVLLHGSTGILGLLITQRTEPNAYSHIEQEILESFAAHAAIAIENSSLYRQAQERAAVEERRRLARELHDSVAQLLYSMILMNSGWEKMAKENRLSSPAEAFKQLGAINLQALKEMRLLIHHLRPSNLEEMGLVNALQQRLETVEQRAGIKALLEVNGELPPIPVYIEDELYAIVQEALNNSLRHSSASKVAVEIKLVEDKLVLSVQDNGVGFEVQNVKQGIGLGSMKERAGKIDGEIEITSQPGQGTLVIVKVEI